MADRGKATMRWGWSRVRVIRGRRREETERNEGRRGETMNNERYQVDADADHGKEDVH